ncbi:MAG: hypothetical protein A2Z94_04365 [Gallionellales bacterium GWA2_55_18]|nr:MAG: hypothetical protein A2Z94_04365 [Gallionellales bacterium GWA2_55_18]
MSYLARLKQLEDEKISQHSPDIDLPKPPKAPFVSFGGTGTGHIEKKIIDVEIIATPASGESATAWRWLLHYPGHDVEVSTMPESTCAEMLRDFPGAIAAEPIQDTPKRKATEVEAKELRALVAAIYAADTDDDRAEALAAALADPDDALLCYRAIVAEAH